jgi:hypothetical protein
MSFSNFIPSTMQHLRIGDQVRILSTELNFAQDRTGTLEGIKEGGYVVRIKTRIPTTGSVPGSEERDVTVWADQVERA